MQFEVWAGNMYCGVLEVIKGKHQHYDVHGDAVGFTWLKMRSYKSLKLIRRS